MADTQDKIIKIKMDTDSPSVQRFTSSINTMTAAVEKLATVLDKVTRSMGAFEKQQGKTGPGVGKGKPGGGKGGIAESIVGDGSGIKQAAKATETALASTGNNIKRFVDDALKNLARLQAATRAAGGGGGGYSYGGGFTSSTGAMPAGGGGRGDYSSFERSMMDIEPDGSRGGRRGGFFGRFFGGSGGSGGGGAAGGGTAGRGGGVIQAMTGMMNSMSGGTGPIGTGVGGMLGALGVAGGLAAGVAGGLAAYNVGAGGFEDTRLARIQYTQNMPFWKRQGANTTASLFQDQFNNVQSGNLSRVVAFNRALNNPEIRKALNSQTLDVEKLNIKNNMSPESLKTVWGWLSAHGKAAAGDLFQKIDEWREGGKLTELEAKNVNDVALAQAQSSLPAEKRAQFAVAQDYEWFKRGPRANMMMDEIATNALGRTQVMRANLMSSGSDRDGNDAYTMLKAKLLKGGWTPEDRAGGVHNLLGVGWGYGKAVGPMGLVSAGAGGFYNASAVLQSGGVLSGSVAGARGFYDAAQSSMGRGGLDVAVGRELFASSAERMVSSGQFGVGNAASIYASHAAGLIGGAYNGGRPVNDVAMQQYMSGLLSAGNQSFGNVASGRQAPIYNAYSLISAIAATGGKYGIGTENLRSMDPTLLASIAQGGDIPLGYSGMEGISQGSVKSFMANVNTKSLIGLPLSIVGNGANRALFDRVHADGKQGRSYIDTLRNDVAGMSPGMKAYTLLKETSQLGTVMARPMGLKVNEAIGRFLAPLAAEADFAPVLHGKGIHATGAAGLDKLSLVEKGKILEDQGRSIAGLNKQQLEADFKQWRNSAEGAVAGMNSAVGFGENIEMASQSLEAAMHSFTMAVQNSIGSAKNSGDVPQKATTHKGGKKTAPVGSEPTSPSSATPNTMDDL